MNKNIFLFFFLFFVGSCSHQTPIASQQESGEQPFFSSAKNNQVAENITQKMIVSGLEHPSGMAWLPNGDILITERAGRLRIVKDGKLLPQSIAGMVEVYNVGQGGLMDISVHPNFSENTWLYFTYSHGNSQANQTRTARAKMVLEEEMN